MREEANRPNDVEVRRWHNSDDIQAITNLLHRAYAPLAEQGFRYHATWQDADVTLHRLTTGVPFIAHVDQAIVGTVTLYVPPSVSGCEWYNRGDVAYFGQFAVDPDLQGRGIGSRLLDAVEAEAIDRNIPNLGVDTAENATQLIEMYEKRGFEFVGYADFEITNYRSVVMNKVL